MPKCPHCKGDLLLVTQGAGSMLNQDQFDAIKAGDFYCENCPGDGRGKLSYRYFWKRELEMPKRFRKKPVVVEAITFDELVEYGRTHGANIVNGMPWSFFYKGHDITHETDDCYLVPTLEGVMNFNRGDMLITGIKGEIYPCKADIFAATYEAVE